MAQSKTGWHGEVELLFFISRIFRGLLTRPSILKQIAFLKPVRDSHIRDVVSVGNGLRKRVRANSTHVSTPLRKFVASVRSNIITNYFCFLNTLQVKFDDIVNSSIERVVSNLDVRLQDG